MFVEERSAKRRMVAPHEIHSVSAFIEDCFFNLQRRLARLEPEYFFHQKRHTDGSHPTPYRNLSRTVLADLTLPRHFAELARKAQLCPFVGAVASGIWKQLLPPARIEIHERRSRRRRVVNVGLRIL